jgi:hypothetical protein
MLGKVGAEQGDLGEHDGTGQQDAGKLDGEVERQPLSDSE